MTITRTDRHQVFGPDGIISDVAVEVDVTTEVVTYDLHSKALDALVSNRSFLALASPTNAQTLAQVKALTRQSQGLIRLILGRLDAVD